MKKSNLKKFCVLAAGLMIFTACGGSTPTEDTYTYNTYLETNPKTWNVHDWESSDESYITSFTEIGLYECILNSTKDGYEFVSEMASAFPEDKTADINDTEWETYYSDKGNLPQTGYVFDIALNEAACWEDGTPITATDYVESMKRQLDPQMGNFRADSYYSSNLVISNAEKYFKQNTTTIEPLYNYIKDDGSYTDENMAFDGQYYINLGKYTPYVASVFSGTDEDTTFYTVLNQRSSRSTDAVELAAQRITDGVGYYLFYYATHTDETLWKDAEKISDIKDDMWNENICIDDFDDFECKVRVKVDQSVDEEDEDTYEIYSTDDLKTDIKTVVSALGRGGSTSSAWAWQYPLFASYYNSETCDWEDVGIKKIDDYKIRLYLNKSISMLDLKFALCGNWLVKTDLYDKLTMQTGTYKVTTYATDKVDNYMSYGPYKLSSYESGKTINMVRNDKWYGYSDNQHNGQYQMTGIKTVILSEHSTAVQAFEKGELDDITLTKADMKTYGNSSRKTVTPESYTQKISMNTSRAKLLSRQTAKNNKTILANKNFREGFSLAMNRNNFASQTTAGSTAFTGLLNSMYLTDVAIGEMWRNTTQGKSVYGKIYGELGGDPYASDYQTTALEESQNGYNYNMGVYYVAQGIKEELESTLDGHLNSGDTINLEFRVYDNESETTVAMMAFIREVLSNVVTDAVAKLNEDTNYEDLTLKTNIEVVKDENYYNTAKQGGYDLIFSTWGGAAINPYGLMQVYCDSTFESTCEYGFKGKQDKELLSIDVDGDGNISGSETKSYNNWYTTVTGSEYTEQDREDENFDEAAYKELHNRKLNILAGLEAGIVSRFEAIPLVARGSTSLTSFKVENGSNSYVNLVGYGGIRFMTFNYTDAEWSDFINSKDYSSSLYIS